MIASSISRRYARALVEVASAANEPDRVGADLDKLAEAVQVSPELRNLLFNPAFDRLQRHQALATLAEQMGLGATVGNLAKLLVDRGRFHQIGAVAMSYREMADDLAGRARARVTSAVPLPAEIQPRLERALSEAMSRKVGLESTVDPSLLGGVVAQVGSMLFDGSVRTQLESLRRELIN